MLLDKTRKPLFLQLGTKKRHLKSRAFFLKRKKRQLKNKTWIDFESTLINKKHRLVISCLPFQYLSMREEKLISPIPWKGGRRIDSSAFLSRRFFGYHLPITSYGTIFAAKWSSNGGLEALVSKSDLLKVTKVWLLTAAYFILQFSAKCAIFVIFDHTTKPGMKDLLQSQQHWVERDSNLIPPS